jgi:Methylated DNA-protein cysteine methyltransferase
MFNTTIEVTYLHKLIIEQLLNKVENDRGNELITYGELSKRIGGKPTPRNLAKPLGEVSTICKENNLPLITAIVVNGDTMLPGDGFIKEFFDHIKDPIQKERQCIKCINEVIAYNKWEDLEQILKIGMQI